MAVNAGETRIGQVKDRYQYYNTATDEWIIVDATTGSELRRKKGKDNPWKGIRKLNAR